jgi:hypothetical protein
MEPQGAVAAPEDGMALGFATDAAGARPIWLATREEWPDVRGRLPAAARDFAAAAGYEPAAGKLLLLPGPDGLAARDLINTPANDMGPRSWRRRRAISRAP